MKDELKEFRRKGGLARARKLTAEERRESARKAGKASGKARKKKRKPESG